MKGGLYFGSFDPPHVGHLSIISSVIAREMVDWIHVIPTWNNPWKKNNRSFQNRFEMTHMAFSGFHNDNLIVTDIEKTIQSEFTYQTLDWYRDQVTENYRIILTPETLTEIKNWKNGDQILSREKFIVVTGARGKDADLTGLDAIEINSIPVEISSSQVRNFIGSGLSGYPFIPESVQEYITKRDLYK